jgi:hypothetical protein
MVETRIVGSQVEGTRTRSQQAVQGSTSGARPTFSAVDKVGPNGCTARTKSGKFCKGRPVGDTSFCIGHSK